MTCCRLRASKRAALFGSALVEAWAPNAGVAMMELRGAVRGGQRMVSLGDVERMEEEKIDLIEGQVGS